MVHCRWARNFPIFCSAAPSQFPDFFARRRTDWLTNCELSLEPPPLRRRRAMSAHLHVSQLSIQPLPLLLLS